MYGVRELTLSLLASSVCVDAGRISDLSLDADVSLHESTASRVAEMELSFKQGGRVNATEYALAVLSEAQASGEQSATLGSCDHLKDQGMMAAQCPMILNDHTWKMMCGMPPYSSCFQTCCSFRG